VKATTDAGFHLEEHQAVALQSQDLSGLSDIEVIRGLSAFFMVE